MESANPDYEAIAEFLALQSNLVRTHSQIVDPDLVGQPFMLHIDKNTPPVFTPMFPRSADKREDNTTARITVAPTLIGCYIGYNRGDRDFEDGSRIFPGEKDPYRGGYVISEIPFQHCLKVDNTLVPDASGSGEHWLVAYAEHAREYQPTPIGKLFITKMSHKAVSGAAPNTWLTLYIEVQKEEGIKFSPKIHISKGFHRADVLWKSGRRQDCNDEVNFRVREITEEEYNKCKQLTAALLERPVDTPRGAIPYFNNW